MYRQRLIRRFASLRKFAQFVLKLEKAYLARASIARHANMQFTTTQESYQGRMRMSTPMTTSRPAQGMQQRSPSKGLHLLQGKTFKSLR